MISIANLFEFDSETILNAAQKIGKFITPENNMAAKKLTQTTLPTSNVSDTRAVENLSQREPSARGALGFIRKRTL
jgi:hypothetical protein